MSTVIPMADSRSERSRIRFYRFWPAVVTFIIGWVLAAFFGQYMGSQIHNHDLAVCVAFVASAIGGVVAGLVAAAVFIRRNS